MQDASHSSRQLFVTGFMRPNASFFKKKGGSAIFFLLLQEGRSANNPEFTYQLNDFFTEEEFIGLSLQEQLLKLCAEYYSLFFILCASVISTQFYKQLTCFIH